MVSWFVELLLLVLPTHGTFDQMKEFFRNKTWDKPGTEELAGQARQIIEGRQDRGDEISRLAFRSTVVKMIPYHKVRLFQVVFFLPKQLLSSQTNTYWKNLSFD